MVSVDAGSIVLGDYHPMRVTWELGPDGALLRLRGDSPGRQLRLEARVGAAPRLRIPKEEHWSMLRGVPRRGDPMDCFYRATRFAGRAMFDRGEHASVLPLERLFAAGAMKRLYAIVRDVAIHTATVCDPKARAAAMRFAPHLRFRIYDQVVRDPSGRIAQAAEVAPGVVIFALAMMEKNTTLAASAFEREGAGRLLLRRVVQGWPLKKALAEALAAWREAAEAEACCPLARGRQSIGMWHRVADAEGEAQARLLAHKRLLILRARHRAPTAKLLLPPPVAFAPEDVPAKTRANARWYRVMHVASATLIPTRERREVQRGLCRFLSRHGVRVSRLAGRRHVSTITRELLHYVVAQGRVPGRNTDPERLCGESRRWHHEMATARALGDLARLAPAAEIDPESGDVAFPALPAAVGVGPGIQIEPIGSAAALLEEGHQMHHCVASLATDALMGQSYFYSLRAFGERLTVQVHRPSADLVQLGEVAGTCNRVPTAKEMRVLEGWITRLNAELQDPVPF